ncbi:hypothetical protein VOLCADRAFT_93485 [Volvox carteri f. nagariensis]|uniref:Uncharacterized protein n=1 Tax=Volvox carteri f. nagariensis TaxID=3068 RepID=D8U287_VOLCA|nr:uncharacterized protein VOLCADRAFT_93485 [Volvox carteri f. nagariensis]EFJ46088.1 hypothetical protein VOLCADRAFT_93485 [Volvox carteri f. nagariensis]|eukprot:XP_002952838.1 hypothetical protein VOLCADRAFT_93485 [Volvox carteri f. nagariensis]
MGWLIKLCSILLLGAASLSDALWQPSHATRNITVDELLVYGVVPDPGPIPAVDCGTDCGPSPPISLPPPPPPPSIDTHGSPRHGFIHVNGLNGTPNASIGAQIPDEDFIFAAGTCMKRIRLAFASRAWRGPAVRAFFLTDAETPLQDLNARGAAAAEVHFGDTYKWLLYGDDDTVFFLDAVKEMLSQLDLDPEQPIALSDNLWSFERHPNANAPRCLPCRTANQSLPSMEKIFLSAPGRADIRATYHHQMWLQQLRVKQQLQQQGQGQDEKESAAAADPVPRISKEEYLAFARNTTQFATAHGGAGMIFSVGLMRSIAYRDALACFLTFTHAPGGDQMVSECLWRHGFAFTEPGHVVRRKYDYQYVVFGGAPRLPMLLGLPPHGSVIDLDRIGRGPLSVADGAYCNSLCRWMLRHAVSLHLSARLSKDVKAFRKAPAIEQDLYLTRHRRHVSRTAYTATPSCARAAGLSPARS